MYVFFFFFCFSPQLIPTSRYRLVPILLSCGKNNGALTHPMVSATYQQLINCITVEADPSFLSSLYKCFTDSMLVLGGPSSLAPEFHNGIIEATKRQLQGMADKRKARAARSLSMTSSGTLNPMGGMARDLEEGDEEDLALLEEIEDFALEDMTRLLINFDQAHPLLIAVSGVRELAVAAKWDSDEGDDLGEE